MAFATINTVLMWGASATTLTKKVDIKDYPDLLGTPNLLETTTLSNTQQTFVPGVKQLGDGLTFTCNYDAADFALCKADEGTVGLFYSLTFPDGSVFTWQGEHTLGVPGKGVDEVAEFTINVVPSTDIEWAAS